METQTNQRKRPHCLIVDDDPVVAELVEQSLKQDDYTVDKVDNGEEAIELCRKGDIDVILLDYSLPGISGQQVCRAIREFSDAYILMVSANSSEVDRVLTLALGADDYVTKPFSSAELAQRVRGMLRRPRHQIGTRPENPRDSAVVRRIGDLTVDMDARLAATEEGFIDLTELEYKLLSMLVDSSPEAISRRKLIEELWQREWNSDDHIVDVHISNIRSKFRIAGVRNVRIKSVRAHGYRLLPESAQ